MDAAELTAHLETLLPGYRAWSDSDENVSDPDRIPGIFAAAAEYCRTHTLAPDQWQHLADFLNTVINSTDPPSHDAACTRFLKKLAAPDHPLTTLLTGEARTYWDFWS